MPILDGLFLAFLLSVPSGYRLLCVCSLCWVSAAVVSVTKVCCRLVGGSRRGVALSGKTLCYVKVVALNLQMFFFTKCVEASLIEGAGQRIIRRSR